MRNSKNIPLISQQLQPIASPTNLNTPRCCLPFIKQKCLNKFKQSPSMHNINKRMRRVRSMEGFTLPTQSELIQKQMKEQRGHYRMKKRVEQDCEKNAEDMRISLKKMRRVSIFSQIKEPFLFQEESLVEPVLSQQNNQIGINKTMKNRYPKRQQNQESVSLINNLQPHKKSIDQTVPKFQLFHQQVPVTTYNQPARPFAISFQYKSPPHQPSEQSFRQRKQMNSPIGRPMIRGVKNTYSIQVMDSDRPCRLSPRVQPLFLPNARFRQSIYLSPSNNSRGSGSTLRALSPKFDSQREINYLSPQISTFYKKQRIETQESNKIEQSAQCISSGVNEQIRIEPQLKYKPSGDLKPDNLSPEGLSTEISPNFSFCSTKNFQRPRELSTLLKANESEVMDHRRDSLFRISEKTEPAINERSMSSLNERKQQRKVGSPFVRIKSLNTMNTVKSYADSQDSTPFLNPSKNKIKFEESIVVMDFFKSNLLFQQNKSNDSIYSPRIKPIVQVQQKSRSVSQYVPK